MNKVAGGLKGWRGFRRGDKSRLAVQPWRSSSLWGGPIVMVMFKYCLFVSGARRVGRWIAHT